LGHFFHINEQESSPKNILALGFAVETDQILFSGPKNVVLEWFAASRVHLWAIIVHFELFWAIFCIN